MLRFRLIAGLALALTTSSMAQTATTSISSVESLIRSQHYDQALAALKIAIRKNPENYRLWTLQGICFALQGNDRDALAAFDHAIHIQPTYTAALRGETQILYKSGDKRAIPLLERMLKSDPGDTTAQEMLATLQQHNGDCRDAVSHFEMSRAAIATHPASLEAYGYCLFQLDRTPEAIAVFRQLVPLLPGSAYPSYNLAVLLVSAHQNDDAVKVLEPFLTPGQTDPDILSLASQAYEAIGNTPRAVALQRQAIVLNPTEASNYVLFAVLCLTHDSFQVGIDMLNAGLKRISDNSALYLSRGVMFEQLGKFDEAEADFRMAEQIDTTQHIAAYAGDLTMIERNDPQKAFERVREQLRAHPNNPLFHLMVAQLILTRAPAPGSADFNEAMQNALAAAKTKPDLVEAHNQLAGMYMSLNDYQKAIEECRTALQYDPSNEAAMYHLVMSMRHAGHTPEELQPLVQRLAEIHKESLQRETDRKRYRLVEEGSPAADSDGQH
ncbi:MAG TPA: tetratricopeptide repeat protein [Acidobacteriaceae bacterium]|nr:tetratricopeptide repeat protein [Acidobacteriaceae bacterium]